MRIYRGAFAVMMLLSFFCGLESHVYISRLITNGSRALARGSLSTVKSVGLLAGCTIRATARSCIRYPRLTIAAAVCVPLGLPRYRRACVSCLVTCANSCKNFFARLIRSSIGDWLNAPLASELHVQEELMKKHGTKLSKMNDSLEAIHADVQKLREQCEHMQVQLQLINKGLSDLSEGQAKMLNDVRLELQAVCARVQKMLDATNGRLEHLSGVQGAEREQVDLLVAEIKIVRVALATLQLGMEKGNQAIIEHITRLAHGLGKKA